MSSTTTKPPPYELIPGLPNDVALLCLARIPRSQHPIISLVSRPWYAYLRSPALFTTRSHLRVSEPFLYLNLRIRNNFSWYVLIHKTHTKRALVKLPSLPIEVDASKRQLIGTTLVVKSPNEDSSGNFMSAQMINIPKGEIIGTNLGEQEPILTSSAGNSDQLGQLIGKNLGIEASSGNFMSPHLINVTKREHIGTNVGVQTSIVASSGNLKDTNFIDVSKGQSIATSFAVQTPIEPSGQNTPIKVEPFGLSHLINVPKRQPIGPSFAVLGSSIYMIGGSHDEIPSNSMWVFDCRFNVWGMGPKMRVGREFSAAGVVDGKIYVMGGCVVDNWARSMNWAEVYDPVKGGWEPVPSPIEVRDKWMHASAVIGGKVYAMADRGGVVYDVRKGEWGSVTKRLDLGWRGRAAVVGGVLYCYDYLGKIRGYDVAEDRWKELRGVEKGLPKFLCGATMVNFDERLCVVWEGKGSGKEVEIMCAEIGVKKDVDGGLSGVILWSDVILVVPNSASIVQCLVVQV